jgi:hypothetical protein
MQFKDIITDYFENDMKHMNTLCEQNAERFSVKADGTYSNRCALRG